MYLRVVQNVLSLTQKEEHSLTLFAVAAHNHFI